jgi:hypothetical protein
VKVTRNFLASLGYPGGHLYDLPSFSRRFPEAAQYRLELPSAEGPAALAVTLEDIDHYKITVDRISRGSGIMLTDGEIREMAQICASRGMELSLFVRRRGTWDISILPFITAGKPAGKQWEASNILLCQEGVHRAALGTEMIRRYCPDASTSALGTSGLGIPVINGSDDHRS